MAVVPVGELRRLADLLNQLDIELADDLVAGLANRLLRDLARRWADTVAIWAVEAELWGRAAPGSPLSSESSGGLALLTDAELAELVRLSAARLGERQGRPAGEVLADLARGLT